MDKTQQEIWDVLCTLSGEQVANILTDVHGLQLLDDDVRQELVNLGYLEEDN